MGLPILCCKGQRSKSAALPFAAENDRLVFVDFRALYIFAVGEAFMPPANAVRFRLTFRKIETFYRREA